VIRAQKDRGYEEAFAVRVPTLLSDDTPFIVFEPGAPPEDVILRLRFTLVVQDVMDRTAAEPEFCQGLAMRRRNEERIQEVPVAVDVDFNTPEWRDIQPDARARRLAIATGERLPIFGQTYRNGCIDFSSSCHWSVLTSEVAVVLRACTTPFGTAHTPTPYVGTGPVRVVST